MTDDEEKEHLIAEAERQARLPALWERLTARDYLDNVTLAVTRGEGGERVSGRERPRW